MADEVRIFRAADPASTGQVSRKNRCQNPETLAQTIAIFKGADEQGSGKVSRDGLVAVFRQIDADKCGNDSFVNSWLVQYNSELQAEYQYEKLLTWLWEKDGFQPPSAAELGEYHALMDRLKGVKGLHEAAAFPNASVFWDFKSKRALPGRIWHDTSPDWLRAELVRPYTVEEHRVCRIVSGIDRAAPVPEGSQPVVLVVIGPGAAGKSTALPVATKTMDIVVDEFVMVDGDDLRSCHQGWQKHIVEDRVNGYKDAFDIFRDNPDMKMKEKIMKEAIQMRKNLIVPINKNKSGMLQEFKAQGYKVYVLAMLVSSDESKVRCINRANENARYPGAQKKAYLQCLDDLVEICRPEHSDKVVCVDSTDFANMKTVFTRINNMSAVEQLAEHYKTTVSEAH